MLNIGTVDTFHSTTLAGDEYDGNLIQKLADKWEVVSHLFDANNCIDLTLIEVEKNRLGSISHWQDADGNTWSESLCIDGNDYGFDLVLARDTERVRKGLEGIKTIDPDYWTKTLEGRCQSTRKGSFFNTDDKATLEKALEEATWDTFVSRTVAEGCTAFTARIKEPLEGYLGVVQLNNLRETSQMVCLKDPKGTGFLQAHIAFNDQVLQPQRLMTIILGMEGDKEVVFTFHPGLPVEPSRIEGSGETWVTVDEAVKRGFIYAKVEG